MNIKTIFPCVLTGMALPVNSIYASALSNSEHKEEKKTNVIYILADDLGYGDLSCYGQLKFKTPHIDSLASNGIKFTNHYSGCTVSAPSRCALMTGLHTGHTPIRGNAGVSINSLTFDTALPAQYKTIADFFKEKNYATACVGKWGMGGPNTVGHPNNHGFDYFFGHLGQGHAHNRYSPFLYENSNQIVLDGKTYDQDLMMEKVTKFIETNKDNPFFLYLPFTIPHGALQAPAENEAKYLGAYDVDGPWGTPGAINATPHKHVSFAGLMDRLDSDVGVICDLLKKYGIDENTIIIFTSDNGPHREGGGDPEFFNGSGGLRGIKRDLYEGGIRVPMIVYWPEVIKSGRISDHPSAFWDVLPTFCDLLETETPEKTDGISFLPEITGGMQKTHEYLYWEFHETPLQSLRKGDWKAVRKGIKTSPVTELYDLSTDLAEKNDLASKYPDIVKEMNKIMSSSRTNDTQWTFPNLDDEEEVIIDTGNDIQVPVVSGKASQYNTGQNIEYSFDGSYEKPYYHSPWSSGVTTLPVVLEYFFEKTVSGKSVYPEAIDYFIYYPRKDGINGNFGKFNLYVKYKGKTNYDFFKSYDYEISSKNVKEELGNGFKEPAAIKFEVLSGGNNFVSCAEMKFYRKVKTSLTNLVFDEPCIYVENKRIIVRNSNSSVYIYNLSGMLVDIQSELPCGVYIVKTGGISKKVIV